MVNEILTKLDYNKQSVYGSNRGDYVVVDNFKYNYFTIEALEEELAKWKNVGAFFKLIEMEFSYFETDPDKVDTHPFWRGEEKYLIDAYKQLHGDFLKKANKSRFIHSRNICAANGETCVSLLQKWGSDMFMVSRSCDISLGYLADLYTAYLYIKKYKLKTLTWIINNPHIYCNNLDATIIMYKDKDKNRNMLFNKRKGED